MKKIRLYNILLPIWILYFFPPIIFPTMIGNFIIDYLVLHFALPDDQKAKDYILPTFLLGYLSDFIGATFLSLIAFGFSSSDFINDFMYDPLASPKTIFPLILGIALSGFCIYRLNYRWFLKKNLPKQSAKKTALVLAIFTAPYTFLIPGKLFF
ncbi:MAG: hypothetical protein Q4P28_02800 [Tissierellia bacterium]|nr:hypothetical protein [Tissierellia bacterium]